MSGTVHQHGGTKPKGPRSTTNESTHKHEPSASKTKSEDKRHGCVMNESTTLRASTVIDHVYEHLKDRNKAGLVSEFLNPHPDWTKCVLGWGKAWENHERAYAEFTRASKVLDDFNRRHGYDKIDIRVMTYEQHQIRRKREATEIPKENSVTFWKAKKEMDAEDVNMNKFRDGLLDSGFWRALREAVEKKSFCPKCKDIW